MSALQSLLTSQYANIIYLESQTFWVKGWFFSCKLTYWCSVKIPGVMCGSIWHVCWFLRNQWRVLYQILQTSSSVKFVDWIGLIRKWHCSTFLSLCSCSFEVLLCIAPWFSCFWVIMSYCHYNVSINYPVA